MRKLTCFVCALTIFASLNLEAKQKNTHRKVASDEAGSSSAGQINISSDVLRSVIKSPEEGKIYKLEDVCNLKTSEIKFPEIEKRESRLRFINVFEDPQKATLLLKLMQKPGALS